MRRSVMVRKYRLLPNDSTIFAVRSKDLAATSGTWRGGRAVECGGLENRFTCKGNGGSNPSLSAKRKPSHEVAGLFH